MNSKKTKATIFLTFIPLFIFNILYFSLPANAAVNDSLPRLQIPDLNINFKAPTDCGTNAQGNKIFCYDWIGQYIAGIYKYAIGIVGILAAVVLMIGGVIWIVAGGNATMIGEAKAWIGASITGLIIALTSYVILYQVNPALTVFKPLKIARVEKAPEIATSTLSVGWTFDGGPNGSIAKQQGDASSELTNLLNCMRGKLIKGMGNISSISDSNCTGNLSACKSMTTQCRAGSTRTDCRWHSATSCHYGTTANPNKSYAADFNDYGASKDAVWVAASDCKKEYPGLGVSILEESTHLHISVSPCSGL